MGGACGICGFSGGEGMIDSRTLFAYALIVLGLFLIPGPAVLLTLTRVRFTWFTWVSDLFLKRRSCRS
jgi:hypothetical protein